MYFDPAGKNIKGPGGGKEIKGRATKCTSVYFRGQIRCIAGSRANLKHTSSDREDGASLFSLAPFDDVPGTEWIFHLKRKETMVKNSPINKADSYHHVATQNLCSIQDLTFHITFTSHFV